MRFTKLAGSSSVPSTRDQTAARNVVLELAKTAYYVAGGRF